jgi:hypothetical protein
MSGAETSANAVGTKDIAYAKKRTQVRNGFRHRDLQYHLDLKTQGTYTLAAHHEAQEFLLTPHDLVLGNLGEELMLTQRLQYRLKMLQMHHRVIALRKNSDVIVVHYTVPCHDVLGENKLK